MKNKMLVLPLCFIAASFSLVSCYGPDTDERPQEVTTSTVTQAVTPQVTSGSSAEVTTVPKTDITEPEVTTVSEKPVTAVSSETANGFSQAEYSYDALGRLIKVSYDDDNYIEYVYDANGNITEVKKTENGKIVEAS